MLPLVIEGVVWWLLLIGVWVVSLSSVPPNEMYIAAIAAIPCAVTAVIARRAIKERWRPRLRWLGWFAVLPLSVLTDTPRVWWAAIKHIGHDGPADTEMRTVQLRLGERVARADARRAIAALAVSATPATMVVNTDQDENTLLVHSLVRGTPSMEKVVGK